MIKLKSLFRRGQGTSPSSTASASAKQTHQISPSHSVGIKSSASASSLDRIAVVHPGSASADLGATRKLSKSNKQSSKDKLNDLLKGGSKEKLFDDKKELKRQHKQQQKQMQQIAQQQSSNVYQPSSTVGDQRPEQTHSKDFESTAFNGMQDVSFFNSFISLSFSHPRTYNFDLQRREFVQSDKSHFQLNFSCRESGRTTEISCERGENATTKRVGEICWS